MKTKILLCIILLAFYSSAQIPYYVPTNGLVGWWPFNGNANDESGNGNHGVINGSVLTEDRFGNSTNAYLFTSANANYISMNNNPVQNGNATISGWFNSSSTPGGPFFHIGTDNSTNGVCNGYFTGLGNINYFSGNMLKIDASCVGSYDTGWSANSNIWYHFLLTRSQNTLSVYINGVLIDFWTPSSIINPDNKIFIGSSYYSNSAYFNGKLDDIGIWNRTLTNQEILALYQGCQMSITTQPINQNVFLSSGNTSFNVSTNATNPTYQWQTNLGVGFQNLSNVGQYSGVNTANLTVSNLALSNDNQVFRCVITESGCSDTSDVVILSIIDDASISSQNESSLVISPNPIKHDFSISGIEQIISLSLKDLNGKLLKSFDVQEKNYSISNLTAGVYFLEVHVENQSYIIKVVKE